MAELKDDASTGIEEKVKNFVKDINAGIDKIRKPRVDALKKAVKKARANKPAAVPEVNFRLSKTTVSKSRTPAEQAKLVVQGSTYVCWSSHMADKARHVTMKVDGKISWKPKTAFGDDFATFKKKWGEVMKRHGLKNASGKDGWPSWDQFHLELPDSKVARSDERAKSCLDEYARLTRKEGKKKNSSFESKYSKFLKTYVEQYEKDAKKPEGETGKKAGLRAQ